MFNIYCALKFGAKFDCLNPLKLILSLALIGPFPRSKKGHKWLLVVSDWFSKYTLIFLLRDSPKIVHYLENDVSYNNMFLNILSVIMALI